MENAPGAPPQDPELASMLVVFQELARLPDDESRRRVIAYAQSRCIKSMPPSDFARWQGQQGLGQVNHGAIARGTGQDPGYLQQLQGQATGEVSR